MKNFLSLLSLSLLLTSCAGVINGTSQPLTFTSEPSGAEVVIDGMSMGVTPLTINLKKNKYKTVMIKKAGYVTQTRPLTTSFDNTALLNVFWDSSTTDQISGAAYEYSPGAILFNLAKE